MNRRDQEIEAQLIVEKRGPRNQRELLALIRPRPAMYLGKKSLEALSQYLSGYVRACEVHGLPEARTLGHLCDSRFERWLAREKNLGIGACDWSYQLRQECEDDAVALERFFEFVDEFEQLPESEDASGANTGDI